MRSPPRTTVPRLAVMIAAVALVGASAAAEPPRAAAESTKAAAESTEATVEPTKDAAQPTKAAAVPSAAPSRDPQSCIRSARKAVRGASEALDSAKGAAAYTELRACLLDLLQAGKDAHALTVAGAANDLFPAEPRSGIDLGLLMIQTGADLIAAREVLTQALKRPGRFTDPSPADLAEGYLSLGRIDLGRGDLTSARAALSQALAALPSDAETLYTLAAADQKAGDALACATHIDKAMQVRPDLATRDDYLIAAWALSRTDRPAEAQALLRRAIAAMPNASGLHLGLGYALAVDSKPVEALLEYWYEFENDAADDPYAKEARVQFQDSLGRAQAFPKFASSILLLRMAVEDTAESSSTVLANLQKLDEAGVKHPTLDLLRAETLHAAGDATTAEVLLRKLLATDPAFLPTYFDLALILRSSQRDEEARRLVAEAVKRNPAHWQLIGEAASPSTPPQ